MAKAEESFLAQRRTFDAEQERSIQEIQQKFQLEFQNVSLINYLMKSRKSLWRPIATTFGYPAKSPQGKHQGIRGKG